MSQYVSGVLVQTGAAGAKVWEVPEATAPPPVSGAAGVTAPVRSGGSTVPGAGGAWPWSSPAGGMTAPAAGASALDSTAASRTARRLLRRTGDARIRLPSPLGWPAGARPGSAQPSGGCQGAASRAARRSARGGGAVVAELGRRRRLLAVAGAGAPDGAAAGAAAGGAGDEVLGGHRVVLV